MKPRYAAVLMGLLAVPAVPSLVFAVDALRLTYDAGGAPVTFERDNAGNWQVDGLPYPGLVLYRPATKVVYYQHPDVPQWLAVPLGVTETVSATLARGSKWEPWQDQESFDYKVKTAAGDCAPLYASAGAGVQAGLSLADVWRILSTVAWLNAGKAAPDCDRLGIEDTKGQAVGLPLQFMGPNGDWKLQELARAGVAAIALPVRASPADEQTRLTLLLRQFGPDERKNFVTAYASLPTSQQIRLLEEALSGASQP